MTKTKKALAAGALLAFGTVVARSQIPGFGGLVVFDPTNLGEAVTQTGHLVTQIAKAVETIQLLTQQYQHMRYMAQFIADQYKYRAPSTLWHAFESADTYGRNAGWLAAVNLGSNAAGGWTDAVIRTVAYPGGLARLSASQVERKEKDVATLELMDGAGIGAMDTVGRIRANGPKVETAMQSLEVDTLSENPDMNTTAARLGTANAIALLNAKAAADTNKLLVSTAELELLRTKQEHDAAAKALLSDGAFRSDGEAALHSQHDGASDLMTGFRLP
jgi:hypothetical protein